MSDTDLHAIEASLRRQFAPPSLDALEDRLAAACAGDSIPTVASAGRRRVALGVLGAVAAAAAIVLVIARPRPPETSAREVAGRQLTAFLHAAASREDASAAELGCMADEPTIAGSDARPGAPVLPPSPDRRVVWECGGGTGIDCAAYDLPAERMLLVQLIPSGAHVIVCIEPPGVDPRPELPSGSDYNIFRRTLGGWVLYEITPLDTPGALDSISI